MRQPKWQRRAEDRPREICAAALEIFAEKGFAAAKLDEIAKRAGVSKGTLYLYFKDKEQLFRAVIRDTVVPNVENMRADLCGKVDLLGQGELVEAKARPEGSKGIVDLAMLTAPR